MPLPLDVRLMDRLARVLAMLFGVMLLGLVG